MTPNVNEVWMTKNKQLCLIVSASRNNGGKAMFWRDEVSGEWTVSEILDRLDHKTELSIVGTSILTITQPGFPGKPDDPQLSNDWM